MPVTPRTLPFNPSTGRFDSDGDVERVLPKLILNLIEREIEASKATLQDYIDIANLELCNNLE